MALGLADVNLWSKSDIADLIPIEWDRVALISAAREQYWSFFMGQTGSGQPVVVKAKRKNSGEIIRIELVGSLRGAGTRGADSSLLGNEERPPVTHVDVTIDYVSHGVVWHKLSDFISNQNLRGMWAQELGGWAGRDQDDVIFTGFLPLDLTDAARNPLYHGNKTFATLVDADTITYEDIEALRAKLAGIGAKPLRSIGKGPRAKKVYGMVVSRHCAEHIRALADWKQAQREAAIRGLQNPIFTGALGMVHGMVVYEYDDIEGWQGCAMRPAGILSADPGLGGTTLTFGTAAQKRDFTRFFPDVNFYVRIVRGAATEIVQVTAKTAYSFTCGATAAAHPIGTTIELCSAAAGGSIERVLGFGAQCVGWAVGQRPKLMPFRPPWAQQIGVGIDYIAGVAGIKDARTGKYANHAELVVACPSKHLAYS